MPHTRCPGISQVVLVAQAHHQPGPAWGWASRPLAPRRRRQHLPCLRHPRREAVPSPKGGLSESRGRAPALQYRRGRLLFLARPCPRRCQPPCRPRCQPQCRPPCQAWPPPPACHRHPCGRAGSRSRTQRRAAAATAIEPQARLAGGCPGRPPLPRGPQCRPFRARVRAGRIKQQVEGRPRKHCRRVGQRGQRTRRSRTRGHVAITLEICLEQSRASRVPVVPRVLR